MTADLAFTMLFGKIAFLVLERSSEAPPSLSTLLACEMYMPHTTVYSVHFQKCQWQLRSDLK